MLLAINEIIGDFEGLSNLKQITYNDAISFLNKLDLDFSNLEINKAINNYLNNCKVINLACIRKLSKKLLIYQNFLDKQNIFLLDDELQKLELSKKLISVNHQVLESCFSDLGDFEDVKKETVEKTAKER